MDSYQARHIVNCHGYTESTIMSMPRGTGTFTSYSTWKFPAHMNDTVPARMNGTQHNKLKDYTLLSTRSTVF